MRAKLFLILVLLGYLVDVINASCCDAFCSGSCQRPCGSCSCCPYSRPQCAPCSTSPDTTTENPTTCPPSQTCPPPSPPVQPPPPSVNNNTVHVNVPLNITNTISNVNEIHVPIIINHSNINNVACGGSCNHTQPSTTTTRSTSTTTTTTTTPTPIRPETTTCVPTCTTTCAPTCTTTCKPTCDDSIIPVAVPVPVPATKYIYYPVYIPPPPQPRHHGGCCVVISPCYQSNCQTYRQTCGQECISPTVYEPRNPCGSNNCRRRRFYLYAQCHPGGYCNHNSYDCSNCGNDFYSSYDTFSDCQGCFTS